MFETHPFEIFIPENTRYILLGSFVARRDNRPEYDWYYSTKQNQFWKILEQVYNRELKIKQQKQALFNEIGIAIADLINACDRTKNDSADTSLKAKTYNTKEIGDILESHPVQEIFFSSRFVEKEFQRYFAELIESYPQVKLTTLPSPSPRYARMSLQEKVEVYRKILPKYK